MKRLISFLIVALAAISAYCREIKGTVLDENNAPLDFVNVVLYCDSYFVAGGITDSTGTFSLISDAINLTAKITFVGYENCTVEVPSDGNMGEIILTPTTVQLGEVVVKATRPATIMKGNALVTNVEGSSLALRGPRTMSWYACQWW